MTKSDSGAKSLEEHANAVRRSAEAHMGQTHKDDHARKSANADAEAVEAHHELTDPKHSKGLPAPGNQGAETDPKK